MVFFAVAGLALLVGFGLSSELASFPELLFRLVALVFGVVALVLAFAGVDLPFPPGLLAALRALRGGAAAFLGSVGWGAVHGRQKPITRSPSFTSCIDFPRAARV